MDLCADFLFKKGFNIEKFNKMSSIFKESYNNNIFKSEYLWMPCEDKDRNELIEGVRKFFKKYTNFSLLNILHQKEGFWIRPEFNDWVDGGKGSYLEDIVTAEYAISLNEVIPESISLLEILDYKTYLGVIRNDVLTNALGYWLTDESEEYRTVRSLILNNSNMEQKFTEDDIKSEVVVSLCEDAEVTRSGFPYFDKESYREMLKKEFQVN